jgi:hypothetical protein
LDTRRDGSGLSLDGKQIRTRPQIGENKGCSIEASTLYDEVELNWTDPYFVEWMFGARIPFAAAPGRGLVPAYLDAIDTLTYAHELAEQHTAAVRS